MMGSVATMMIWPSAVPPISTRTERSCTERIAPRRRVVMLIVGSVPRGRRMPYDYIDRPVWWAERVWSRGVEGGSTRGAGSPRSKDVGDGVMLGEYRHAAADGSASVLGHG